METGILRKNKPEENHEELLVFGYACKLFRDDEKALFIDQGKHLIPWMGDEKLKIDRYDGRGALSDLQRVEASQASSWLSLSESDRKVEELCDKERYYSLYTNEEEEEMYKEEELKRQKTNAVHYSYDVPTEPKEEGPEPRPDEDEEEEDYVPSPQLDVPVDINIPKTVKEYARIEKTAKFVCTQGPQMEILIKAKQSDNPQFGFLNQPDPLYKFYRHVLSAFKSGRFNGETQKTEVDQKDDVYLHPSLSASAQAPESGAVPAATIAATLYKPSEDCAYSQLVNRIQGGVDGQTATNQYYQYYYSAQYYEYYKQMQPPPPPAAAADSVANNSTPSTGTSTTSIYAQIVSNVNKDNPYTAEVPKLPQTEPKTRPLLSLAADYGSDSCTEDEEPKNTTSTTSSTTNSTPANDVKDVYLLPSGETQIVIDKMAVYVSKNGEQFEDIVKAKGDPRFDFLAEGHQYNKYYRMKIKDLKGVEGPSTSAPVATKTSPDSPRKKVIVPVSFSIKKQQSVKEEPKATSAILDQDPILEMIDLTYDRKQVVCKRAEDKIKDKIAAVAREKLAAVSRDKALQMERKKKAAAFLKMKSGEMDVSKKTEEDKKSDNDEDLSDDRSRRHKKRKKHKRKHSRSDSRKKRRKRRSSSSASSDSQ